MKILSIIVVLLSMSIGVTQACSHPSLETVEYVDVEKYMGEWYEIGKIPTKFQKKCLASKAVYKLLKCGTVKVVNICTTKGSNKLKKAKGIAFIKDKKSNSKLKVGFAPIFKYLGWFTGDYYIMELAEDYSYVLVGSPSREFLWILSRSNTLDDQTYQHLLEIADDRGFDISRVEKSATFNR